MTQCDPRAGTRSLLYSAATLEDEIEEGPTPPAEFLCPVTQELVRAGLPGALDNDGSATPGMQYF